MIAACGEKHASGKHKQKRRRGKKPAPCNCGTFTRALPGTRFGFAISDFG